MIRPLIFAFVTCCASPALACSPALFERLDLPVREDADRAMDVAEIQSAEGGEWKIWLGADGRAEEIVRVDYGEMVRLQTRMIIEGPDAYAVTETRFAYSVPIYIDGSMTVRIETDIYLFCDGALKVPSEDFGTLVGYAESADDALSTFRAEEIADYAPF